MVDEKKEALDALERLLAYTNGLGACEAYTSRAALLTAQDVNAGMLEALKNINTMACYSSEEDIDSREEVLIMIGNAAREAITHAGSVLMTACMSLSKVKPKGCPDGQLI